MYTACLELRYLRYDGIILELFQTILRKNSIHFHKLTLFQIRWYIKVINTNASWNGTYFFQKVVLIYKMPNVLKFIKYNPKPHCRNSFLLPTLVSTWDYVLTIHRHWVLKTWKNGGKRKTSKTKLNHFIYTNCCTWFE